MIKLKTLKNFGEKTYGYKGKVYSTDELKEEAIKWIKECAKDNLIDLSLLEQTTNKQEYYSIQSKQFIEKIPLEGQKTAIALIGWIKHFFNITEEDLK
jgi:hypothetical protein